MLAVDVRRSLPAFTLRVRAELGRGEVGVTGVVGASGAGKSTLLAVLAGLERPDEGRVELDGETLFDAAAGIDLPPERRRIAYVFQDARLFPHRSVRANLLFGHRLRPPAERAFELDRVVDLLELGPLLERRPAKLSGGERQRVALGRAILASPRLLLLDEPLASVDVGLRGPVLAFLRRVDAELGLPMIYVSHSLDEVQALAREVLVLERGESLGCGDLFDVLLEDRAYLALHRLGLENLLEVEVEGEDEVAGVTRARLGPHAVSLPLRSVGPGTGEAPASGGRARVGIRPEELILARKAVPGLSARNCLRGRVGSVDRVRGRCIVRVDVGGQPLRAELTPASVDDLGVCVGADVWVVAKTHSFTWKAPRA